MLSVETRKILIQLIDENPLNFLFKRELLGQCFCLMNQTPEYRELLARFFAIEGINTLNALGNTRFCQKELEEFLFQTLNTQNHTLNDYIRLVKKSGAHPTSLQIFFQSILKITKKPVSERLQCNSSQLTAIMHSIDKNQDDFFAWLNTQSIKILPEEKAIIGKAASLPVPTFFLVFAISYMISQNPLKSITVSLVAVIIVFCTYIFLKNIRINHQKEEIICNYIRFELPDAPAVVIPSIPSAARGLKNTSGAPHVTPLQLTPVSTTYYPDRFIIRLATEEEQEPQEIATATAAETAPPSLFSQKRRKKHQQKDSQTKAIATVPSQQQKIPEFPLCASLASQYFVRLWGRGAGLEPTKSRLWGIWNEVTIRQTVNADNEQYYRQLFNVFCIGKLVAPVGCTGIKYLPSLGWEVKDVGIAFRVTGNEEENADDAKGLIFQNFGRAH